MATADPWAASDREARRQSDGRFGFGTLSESDVDLDLSPEVASDVGPSAWDDVDWDNLGDTVPVDGLRIPCHEIAADHLDGGQHFYGEDGRLHFAKRAYWSDDMEDYIVETPEGRLYYGDMSVVHLVDGNYDGELPEEYQPRYVHEHLRAQREADETAQYAKDTAYLREVLDREPTRPDRDDLNKSPSQWVGDNTPGHRKGLGSLTVSGFDLPPLVFGHNEALDPDKIEPIANANHSKPEGGLWLSPGTVEEGSGWDRLLASDEYSGSDVARSRAGRVNQTVHLIGPARVLKVDSRADLLRAADAYPPGGNEPAERAFYGMRAFDWKALANDYDAIWVTDKGIRENHMASDDRDESLYSWDTESVVVFSGFAVSPGQSPVHDPNRR